MIHEVQNLIGGKHSPARSGAVLDNINPATGSIIGTVPRSNAGDVDAAVHAALEAQPAWGSMPIDERAQWLDRIADGLEESIEEIAVLESQDTGKPIHNARTIDAARSVANFRHFAHAIRGLHDDAYRMTNALNYTQRVPIGVCGLISPWNLPLYLLSWKVAPALAMGNAVICKPSELTPLTAHFLGKISVDRGLPPGVLNIVHGLGDEVGQAITEHMKIGAISFTGGTTTGRRVALATAPRFAKTSLELGGKNATVVFASACTEEHIEHTLDGIVQAGFANQGQVCLCGSRLLIESSVWNVVIEGLVRRIQAIEIDDPSDEKTRFGALISQAHRDKVESYVTQAVRDGGKILAGGGRPVVQEALRDGAWLEPTLITGLPKDHACHLEEIFGPVVVAEPFTDEVEAIVSANSTEYGLAASVWTRDLTQARRVSESLETGMVWVNTWLHRDLRVPFGGVKQSGIGREGGRWALEFFSEIRNICLHDD